MTGLSGKVTLSPDKRLFPVRFFPLRCMLLGKMDNTKARNRSHSRVATHRVQRLNLHWKRLWWPEAGYYVRLRLSVKGIRTIKKYGLQRAADKFGLNLKRKKYYAGYSHRYAAIEGSVTKVAPVFAGLTPRTLCAAARGNMQAHAQEA